MDRIKNLVKTAKRWNIPEDVALRVIERDTYCIYCGCDFDYTIRAKKPSWEHIINNIKLNDVNNISLCCVGCNASKGTKDLNEWLVTSGAKKRGATYPKHLKNKL